VAPQCPTRGNVGVLSRGFNRRGAVKGGRPGVKGAMKPWRGAAAHECHNHIHPYAQLLPQQYSFRGECLGDLSVGDVLAMEC
jgi:hypothetical protein